MLVYSITWERLDKNSSVHCLDQRILPQWCEKPGSKKSKRYEKQERYPRGPTPLKAQRNSQVLTSFRAAKHWTTGWLLPAVFKQDVVDCFDFRTDEAASQAVYFNVLSRSKQHRDLPLPEFFFCNWTIIVPNACKAKNTRSTKVCSTHHADQRMHLSSRRNAV